MIRDDVLKMPAGRAMDQLIAENIFGWSNFKQLFDEIYGEDENGDGWALPYYSTNIAAAWQIVEKFSEVILRTNGKYWFCDFAQENYDYSQANTAPLAICRAALLATIK